MTKPHYHFPALQVPGRHEARALGDTCMTPLCHLSITEPVVVHDLPNGNGREAAYRCELCGNRWVCWWSDVGGSRHRFTSYTREGSPA